jgi:hypothetical protein
MHAPPPVLGYQPISDERLRHVNRNKLLEANVLRALDDLQIADGRWVAIARTHFEQGFMALNRAILQPKRVDPETVDRA